MILGVFLSERTKGYTPMARTSLSCPSCLPPSNRAKGWI